MSRALATRSPRKDPPEPTVAELPVAASTVWVPDGGRWMAWDDGDHDGVARQIEKATGFAVLFPFTCRKFFTVDGTRGAAIVLHRLGPFGEPDLLAWSSGASWPRSILRNAAQWAFVDLKARRLVARVRMSDVRLRDLAKRAGFTFEGRAAGYFPDNETAAVFAMLPSDCPWLVRN